jgi:hypothetical protein
MNGYDDIVGDGGSRILEQVAEQRTRIIDGLVGVRHLAAVGRDWPRALASNANHGGAHGLFGTMSLRDWQRWAYRHTNHHLRRFGI